MSDFNDFVVGPLIGYPFVLFVKHFDCVKEFIIGALV